MTVTQLTQVSRVWVCVLVCEGEWVCVSECVRACMRACVRACMRACVCVCVCVLRYKKSFKVTQHDWQNDLCLLAHVLSKRTNRTEGKSHRIKRNPPFRLAVPDASPPHSSPPPPPYNISQRGQQVPKHAKNDLHILEKREQTPTGGDEDVEENKN